ncbi:MAG TPA: lactate utilization protein B [Thermoguttaceae bacterium]|nr:lactate utilization protein B [Thermoguttaceae bacterium]
MMEHIHYQGAAFLKDKTPGLAEPGRFESLGTACKRSADHVDEQFAELAPWQEWRSAAQAIKQYALANLDKLLVELERNLKAKGVEVLWAADAAEANRLVIEIAQKHGVKNVVKGKTMVSEEMELNHRMAEVGIRALETDLGEYLVQLAGQRPTHIVTPALHLSAEDVGRLFAEKLGEPYTAEHRALTDIARRHLREEYLKADLGVSGVNFAAADTGTLVFIENEGNGGLSTSVPPIHVALMGIEKVIPSIRHLPVFLNLLGRSGTAQKLTTYTHLLHGPAPGRKLYLIIVDNGRTNVLADSRTRSSLGCIRCGACLNHCPVYRRVGGWAYGWVYPGPIGAIITPQLVGLKQAAKLPFASSLCGACSEVCPVKIDIPHQLVYLRKRGANEPSSVRSLVERVMWQSWSLAMGGPMRYRLASWAVRIGTRLVPFMPWRPWYLGAWTRGRELPRLPAAAFRKTWTGKRD